MSRINTVPKGLQSFLGNTNFGDNPSELSEVAAPVVQLNPFLQVDQMRARSSAAITTVNSPGNAIEQFAVPQNKIWFVLGFGIKCLPAVAVANFGQHVDIYNYPQGEGADAIEPIMAAEFHNMNATVANRFWGQTQWLPAPLPVPGDCTIRYFFEYTSTATTYEWRTYLWYYEVDA